MNKNILKKIILVLFLLITSACENSLQAEAILPSGEKIFLELALTTKEKEQGLMFRKELDEKTGMLFIFDKPQYLSFWMKNTLFPLDVLFINEKERIVDIKTLLPCEEKVKSCPSYRSKKEARYALEINAGKAEEWGVRIGDRIILKLPQ